MCGFTGFFTSDQRASSTALADLKRMSETLIHRGPDSSGEWFDADTGVGLAHRRLAIQDLSSLGHQPMHSATKRYVIVFNGEIYNFKKIKRELSAKGITFRGHSDTEVMLAAVEMWGIHGALEQFTGMFSFALFDRQEKLLVIARDRMGEKPLYYGWQERIFLFGSELKALSKVPEWKNNINRDALRLLFRHNFIPAPYSIFSDIYKLEPGTYLKLDIRTNSTSIHSYWSTRLEFQYAIQNPLDCGPEEAVDLLEDKIKHAIRGQLIADVPVGAFLSGGIDSSVIVALMQSISSTTVKTFTIGFREKKYNEAVYAGEISNILGTEHTELYVTPEQAMNVIPDLPGVYDEPFADSSQIPTFLISQLARNSVTVALSGDGGDELFCGYSRYHNTIKAWKKLNRYPALLRLPFSCLLKLIPRNILQSIFRYPLEKWTDYNHHLAGDRISERAILWSQASLEDFYRNTISYWHESNLVPDSNEAPYALANDRPSLAGSEIQILQYLDMVCYLPDDILVKVDRAAMAHSLETRIPLLDREVVEFAMRIPSSVNVSEGQSKWPLRRILSKYIPQELINRPKKGFAVPVNEWLKGPLKDWANDLLNADRLKREGYINPGLVNRYRNIHLKELDDVSFKLWGVLMFESWLESWYK